jgi:SSS family transporter
MIGIGAGLGLFVRNIGDFFTGSGSVPWSFGAVSNYMTMMSAFVFVAHAGVAYQYGLVAVVILWSAIPPTLIGAWYLGKRWKRANIITPVEYLETRYNGSVRQLTSWGGVLFRLIESMLKLYAVGLFIATTTSLTLSQAVLLCGGIVIVYTMIGGLWSVVLTDTVQCVILVLITTIMIPLTLTAVGGFMPLIGSQPDHFRWNNGPKGNIWFLLAYFVMVTIKYSGNWSFVQRFYSMKDEPSIRAMGLFSALLYFVFPVIFLLPAVAAPMLLPKLENPESAYIGTCLLLLPPGLMGLMISAMLAACMSTLSAEYNITAGVLTKDIYQRLLRKQAGERELMLVARLMTLAVGSLVIGGAVFVERFGGAFELNKLITGLFGVPLVVPLVFGLIWKRPRSGGAVAAILCGISIGVVLNLLPSINWEIATLLQTACCIAILLLSGYRTPKETPEEISYRNRVDQFFEQIETPYVPPEETETQQGRRNGIMRLFAVSLIICGLMFIFASLLNLHLLGGKLTLGAGMACCLTGAFQIIFSIRKTDHVHESDSL